MQTVANKLLLLARRRRQLHGKLIPVAYWARRLQRKLDLVISDDKKKIQPKNNGGERLSWRSLWDISERPRVGKTNLVLEYSCRRLARYRPTIHRHSQSNDPTGISAKGLAPTGISSGMQMGGRHWEISLLLQGVSG